MFTWFAQPSKPHGLSRSVERAFLLSFQRVSPQPADSDVDSLREWPRLRDLLRVIVLAMALLALKALVLRAIYGSLPSIEWFQLTAQVATAELALVSAFFLLNAAISPSAERVRFAAFLAGPTALLTLATSATGLFLSWGSLLDFSLLALAPDLLPYLPGVGLGPATPALFLLLGSVLASFVAAPLARHVARASPRVIRPGRAWSLVFMASFIALAAFFHDRFHGDSRQALARRVGLGSLLSGPGKAAPTADIASDHAERLAGLLGQDEDRRSKAALEPLRNRKPNILLWVSESAGSRYLRSFSPLGSVETPFLDAELQHGVSFSRAYAESPLTVQSAWALLTGESPPARPFVFLDPKAKLPHHGTTLQDTLKSAGYQTGAFCSSYFEMWGARKIFDLSPFDRFEDADNLLKVPGVRANGVGVEDRAIVDSFLDWIDRRDVARPFFGLVWTIESHRPYTWAGMTANEAALPEPDRYLLSLKRTDALMGRLFAELRRRGLGDTLVVVVGDHGEGMGRPPRPWDVSHSGQVYEDAVNVPLVFIHPSLSRASIPTLTTHRDLVPTFADIAGSEVSIEGSVSLLRPVAPRGLLLRSILWSPMAFVTPRYKGVFQPYFPAPELYDLSVDLSEANNLATQLPEIERVLADEMVLRTRAQAAKDPTFRYNLEWMAVAQGVRRGGLLWNEPQR